MAESLLVAVIVLQSITLVIIAVPAIIYIRRLNNAIEQFGETAKDIRSSVLSVADDLRRTIKNTDELVLVAKSEVESIGRFISSVEKLVEVTDFFQAAEKAVTSSRTTVASVLQGIKAGLKALRTTKSEPKEGSEDGE